MPLKRENAVYAEGFRFPQEGHAVWLKILLSKMKHGACGYLNGDRDWVTIVQLTDIKAVQEILSLTSSAATTKTRSESLSPALNLTPLEGIKVADIGGSTDWSEKISTEIRRQALDAWRGQVSPSISSELSRPLAPGVQKSLAEQQDDNFRKYPRTTKLLAVDFQTFFSRTIARLRVSLQLI